MQPTLRISSLSESSSERLRQSEVSHFIEAQQGLRCHAEKGKKVPKCFIIINVLLVILSNNLANF